MITIALTGSQIAQGEDGTVAISLVLRTTNTAYPGEELTFNVRYPVSMTAIQIKSDIDAAVTLLWQTKAQPQWTI